MEGFLMTKLILSFYAAYNLNEWKWHVSSCNFNIQRFANRLSINNRSTVKVRMQAVSSNKRGVSFCIILFKLFGDCLHYIRKNICLSNSSDRGVVFLDDIYTKIHV